MTTYAMPLADLDNELKAIFKKKSTVHFPAKSRLSHKLINHCLDGRSSRDLHKTRNPGAS